MKMRMSIKRKGAGLLLVIGVAAVVGIALAGLLYGSITTYASGARLRDRIALMHMIQGAEARAKAEIAQSPAYIGAKKLALAPGEVSIAVRPADSGGYAISVTAAVPRLASPRKIERDQIIWKR